MSKIFIILPHQLFDKIFYDIDLPIIIWEHPHYFTKYNYNKKKLILHRASMKYQHNYLKEHNFKVKYVEFHQKFDLNPKKEYLMYDPIDKLIFPDNVDTIETPNFLLDSGDCEAYRDKTDKFFFNAFYLWSKKMIDNDNWNQKKWQRIVKMQSLDKLNRKKFSKTTSIPSLPSAAKSTKEQVCIDEAKIYVEKHFRNNCGNIENFIFPISHKTAKIWLTDFIKKKLNNFGNYQDAIVKDEPYLFHSVLSTSINIGLINPSEIIAEILNYRGKIPDNSLEGYIRQLFWREYQRYCYMWYDFSGKNYFGNRRKLDKNWYNGTLNIDPVDDCIVRGFDTGYLHHIERLMIVGNFMNLSSISPKEGFRWFMEFSCDSYEWVMHQNVYEMVFFISGGDTMRRPYISSSNYVLKMSDYGKGEWSEKWDKLYYEFLKKNKEKLWKFRYYFRSL
jgi:deoxyribodipyrimidine photolyase-related protein